MTESRARIFTPTFLILAAYGMLALGLSLMLVTGLPLYLRDQGWEAGRMGTILGAYFLTSMVVRPFVGREADRRGRKAILIVGALLLLLPCPGYLFTTSSTGVLCLRVVQGVGWAMATTATSAMASEIVPQDRLGTGMGIYGILNGLGFTFGPALGAYLLNTGGPTAFVAAATLLALGVLVCALALKVPAPASTQALSWSDAGALTRMIGPALFVTLAVSFGYGAIQTFLPLHARDSGVANPGIFFTVFSVLSFISRPGMGRVSDFWGRKPTAALLMLIIAGTFALLATSAALPSLIAAGVLYGIGHGAIYTVLMALVADLVPPKERGLAFGVFGTAIDLGITSGNFVFGHVVPAFGYAGGFLLAAVIVLASLPVLYAQRAAVVPAATVVAPNETPRRA